MEAKTDTVGKSHFFEIVWSEPGGMYKPLIREARNLGIYLEPTSSVLARGLVRDINNRQSH